MDRQKFSNQDDDFSIIYNNKKIRNHTITYWYIHIINYSATKNGIVEEWWKVFVIY